MSYPALPCSVTYTGTRGAGMVATIAGDSADPKGGIGGGLSGAWQNNIIEYQDQIRYHVIGAPTSYDAHIALYQAGIAWSVHPYINWIFGQGLRVVAPTRKGFLMEVTYRRPAPGSFPTGTALPTMYGVSFSALEIPADTDAYGHVVVNSAGDPFNPPQNLTIYAVRLKMTRWQTSFSLSAAQSLIGRVNSAAVTLTILGTVPARCLKVLNFAPACEVYLSSALLPVVYEVEIRSSEPTPGSAGGYDRNIIDKGYQAWYQGGSSGGDILKGKIASSMNLQPVPEPVLLDGQGSPKEPLPYTVVDAKYPFLSWQDNCQLPGWSGGPPTTAPDTYLLRLASPAGVYYLPYHIEREADMTPLVDAGL